MNKREQGRASLRGAAMVNHPKDAIEVKFKPLDGHTYKYYVWKKDMILDVSVWFWEALGNSGIGRTQAEAEDAARQYIRGQS
jgi:hypothetical protein